MEAEGAISQYTSQAFKSNLRTVNEAIQDGPPPPPPAPLTSSESVCVECVCVCVGGVNDILPYAYANIPAPIKKSLCQ